MASKRTGDRVIIVMVTCGSKREAERIARVTVKKRLAACGTAIGAKVHSTYRWKGRVESATETLLLLKTTLARFAKLEKDIRRIHSYDVPEIVAIPVVAGSARYLEWVADCVTKP